MILEIVTAKVSRILKIIQGNSEFIEENADGLSLRSGKGQESVNFFRFQE